MLCSKLHCCLSTNYAVALFILLLAGCKPKPSQQSAPRPPTVTVARVGQQELIEWDEFTGRAEAVELVEVRPRVSGHIQEVRFQAGQIVKKGDLLFVIDPRWHEAEFARANAEHERAKVRLQVAERESKRSTQLLTSKAISTEEADAREARFHEAKAALLAAEAARNTAQLDLDYTQIRAAIDGRISRALITPGNHVSGVPGSTAVLATIVSMDPIYVYSDVDESTLLKFNALVHERKVHGNGQRKIEVEMQLADENGFAHRGLIESFDNRLDPNTGSILLRTVFPNADGRIVPGLFARVRVPGSARYPALLIEERAIGTDQGQKFVLTLSPSNTVEYRAVKLGPVVDNKRVVRSGLQAGEQIVVNGLQRVRPGMPVTPEMASGTNNAGSVVNLRKDPNAAASQRDSEHHERPQL
jgi:RND family efflux transporter MFP subunit